VNDLSWSRDDQMLVSGSVDHTAILWDVEKGQKMAVFTDAKHFVNGVALDPLGQYVATMSCDRQVKTFVFYNVRRPLDLMRWNSVAVRFSLLCSKACLNCVTARFRTH